MFNRSCFYTACATPADKHGINTLSSWIPVLSVNMLYVRCSYTKGPGLLFCTPLSCNSVWKGLWGNVWFVRIFFFFMVMWERFFTYKIFVNVFSNLSTLSRVFPPLRRTEPDSVCVTKVWFISVHFVCLFSLWKKRWPRLKQTTWRICQGAVVYVHSIKTQEDRSESIDLEEIPWMCMLCSHSCVVHKYSKLGFVSTTICQLGAVIAKCERGTPPICLRATIKVLVRKKWAISWHEMFGQPLWTITLQMSSSTHVSTTVILPRILTDIFTPELDIIVPSKPSLNYISGPTFKATDIFVSNDLPALVENMTRDCSRAANTLTVYN